MSRATVRIDGTVGQRVTFQNGRKYVTIERFDGRPAGDRRADEWGWLEKGFTAGKVRVEFIDDGMRIEDYSYRVSWTPGLRNRLRREMLSKARKFLGVEHLPWSRTSEDKRSPHWLAKCRPYYLAYHASRRAAPTQAD